MRAPLRRARPPRLAAVAAAVAVLAGCGGSASAPGAPASASTRTPPNLSAFLRLPVATPASCAPGRRGSASGRRSPWVGHVDVSAFVAPSVSGRRFAALGRRLRALPDVQAVYAETRADAYAEYQRLYTCSAQVPPRSLPASYRLDLAAVTQQRRNALVATIRRLPGVSAVSCDPSNPCLPG